MINKVIFRIDLNLKQKRKSKNFLKINFIKFKIFRNFYDDLFIDSNRQSYVQFNLIKNRLK